MKKMMPKSWVQTQVTICGALFISAIGGGTGMSGSNDTGSFVSTGGRACWIFCPGGGGGGGGGVDEYSTFALSPWIFSSSEVLIMGFLSKIETSCGGGGGGIESEATLSDPEAEANIKNVNHTNHSTDP